MPQPLAVSCFSKIQIGFTFLVSAHPGSPGQMAVKRVCVVMVQPSESLTILQKEKDLRSRVDTLSTQKQKRLQQLRERLTADEQLCTSLGTTPFHIPPSCVVPTQQQLADFDQHIQELEAEKVRVCRLL